MTSPLNNTVQLHQLIEYFASQKSVSDFLIKEGEPLWARVHGTLSKLDTPKLSKEAIENFLNRKAQHVLHGQVKDVVKHPLDKDFTLKVGQSRYRANLYQCVGQKSAMALRRFPDRIPLLESLGLPTGYVNLLNKSKGLILITGATGSGKTTTLASSLDYLNKHKGGHIITLEDPVEYLLKSEKALIDQREVGTDVKSFESGLRAALRQDPDVVLIGEMRDPETVKTALDAATTGHLVFATLHTNSAQQTVERITSFFSAERRDWAHAVLSQALLGIVSQVLVPHKDNKSRLLAAELLVNTPEVRQTIREGKSHLIFNAMDTGASRGHILLNRVLKDLVQKGLVAEDDAKYAAYDPAGLEKELYRK